MKRILLLLLVLATCSVNAQTTIYTQDFEAVDTGYTSSQTEGTTFTDVFNRVNPDIGGNSSFIWAVEDSNVTPGTITLDNIDVTGYDSFVFSLDMLAHHYNDWDTEEELLITYTVDGGMVQNLLWVQSTDNSFNEPAAIDTDFDGVGECDPSFVLPALTTGTANTCGTTTSMFANFSSTLINLNSNTNLAITLTFNGFTSTDEGIYLDNILVVGNTGAVNVAPSITGLFQSPDQTILSTDDVNITATITDADGIASAELQYGFTAGMLTETPIAMTNIGDDYSATIPAQADGTTVYYQIVAIDANASPESSMSSEISYTVMDPVPAPALIITEVADPSDNGNARFVEIYNNGTTAIDFSLIDVYLSRFANANTTSVDEQLVGTLNPGEYYVVAGSGANFNSAYGFAPTAISSGVSGNGDDTYVLSVGAEADNGGNIFDVYGEVGTDGTGEDWEYEDSRAVRNSLFDVPSTVWTAVNWTITGATVADMTPGRREPIEYVYDNNAWTPMVPEGNATIDDNIVVNSGSAILSNTVSVRNLNVSLLASLNVGVNNLNVAGDIVNVGNIIAEDATLNLNGVSNQSISGNGFTVENIALFNANGAELLTSVDLEGVLTLNDGELITNNNLTFKSSNGVSAVIAPVINGSITGDVIIEQFYPANRAFRFVSSPVNMSGTIFDNWQQGGLNPGDLGYEMSVGTHITGGATGGFDISNSNNSSAFGFANDGTQAWTPLMATNDPVASLQAGNPYRLFIRGDRSIDLTINDTPNDTKLITRGVLSLNDATQSFDASLASGQFVFVGNPYQSKVDIQSMMSDTDMITPGTEDINPNFMYVWNPNAGSNGAYRAYDFSTSTSVPADTEVNGVLQPGQSMFLQVVNDLDADVPQVTFKENYKTAGANTTSTYSLPQANLNMNLIQAGAIPLDGFSIKFDSSNSDAVDAFDLRKIDNFNENISISNGSDKLTIESRSMPVNGTVIPLQFEQFVSGAYDMSFNLTGITSLNVYLFDALDSSHTSINPDGNTIISKSFDINDANSVISNRFSIVFSNTTLSTRDLLNNDNISFYPNPVKNGVITISGLDSNIQTSIELRNMTGQLLFQRNYDSVGNNFAFSELNNLNIGVYLIQIQQGNQRVTQQIIIN